MMLVVGWSEFDKGPRLALLFWGPDRSELNNDTVVLLTIEIMSIDWNVKISIVPHIWRIDQPLAYKWGISTCQNLFQLSHSTTSTTFHCCCIHLLQSSFSLTLANSRTAASSPRSGTRCFYKNLSFSPFSASFHCYHGP